MHQTGYDGGMTNAKQLPLNPNLAITMLPNYRQKDYKLM
jgi:hypothetical protein